MFLLPLSPSLLLFIHPTALPFPRTRVFLPRIPYLPFVRGICSFNPSEGTRGIDEGKEGGIDNGMQIIFKRWQPRFRLCFFIPSRIFRGEVKHVEWSTEFKKKCYPYKKIAHIRSEFAHKVIRTSSLKSSNERKKNLDEKILASPSPDTFFFTLLLLLLLLSLQWPTRA